MCIIIAKPARVAMPSWETLKNCFDSNHDGAGFMFADKRQVQIYKGFMTFDAFKSALEQVMQRHDFTNLACVMHFRITTHGKTSKGNCHPFPVCKDLNKLHSTHISCSLGMAHNGIIGSMAKFTSADSSDTMEFIRRLASPLLHVNKNILQQKPILDTLHAVSGGRLAFIDKYGNLSIKGDFIKANGVYYSNNSYCGRRSYYSIPSYSKYDAWDSYYGYGWEDSLDSWEDVYSCPKPNLKLNK